MSDPYEIHTDDETEVQIERGALAVPERVQRYQRLKAQVTPNLAVDVLLSGVRSWLVTSTPMGSVIVIKGPQAQAMAELVLSKLRGSSGQPAESVSLKRKST